MLRNIAVLARKGIRGNWLVSLVIGLSVCLSSLTVYLAIFLNTGLGDTLGIINRRSGADLFVVPAGTKRLAEECFFLGLPATFYMDARIEEMLRHVPGIQATSPQVFLEYVDSGQNIPAMPIIGYKPETDFVVGPWLAVNKDVTVSRSSLIMGAKLGKEISVTTLPREGTLQTFYGLPFKVVGVLEPSGTGLDMAVFMPMEAAYKIVREFPLYPERFAPDQISLVAVKAEPGEDLTVLAQRIETSVPGVEVMPGVDVNRALTQRLYAMAQILWISSGEIGLLTLALVGTLFHFKLKQRRKEFGVLQALGLSGYAFNMLFACEVFILAGVGSFTGVGLGFLLSVLGKPALQFWTGHMFAWPGLVFAAFLAVVTWLSFTVMAAAGAWCFVVRMVRAAPFFNIQ